MELRLTQPVAVQMFNAWATFLEQNPQFRVLEDGSIKLDSVKPPDVRVPGAAPVEHAMDGSTIIAWYRAAGEATAQAIAEARQATEVLGLPRSLYVGKLIDLKRGQDRTVYIKCRTITRQAAGIPLYRTLNPSKGQLIELLINPSPEFLASSMAAHSLRPTV